MSGVDINRSIASLVAEEPARARVFQRLRLDFCCGGKATLAESCSSHGLDPNEVASQLEACSGDQRSAGFARAQRMQPAELSRYIEREYHDWLRQELPRLYQLACKAESRHSGHYPWLEEAREIFGKMAQNMMEHMRHEEATVFPAIRSVAASGSVSPAERRTIESELSQLESEHSRCGSGIARLRSLSSDYLVPEQACNTLRALIDGLHDFEQLMHEHVYLENSVLFEQIRSMLLLAADSTAEAPAAPG